MGNYDLSVLSPDEFELLCKDLFEKERRIKLENFKTGKDGGVDLRYSKNKKEDIIVQCKRYESFKSLKGHLQKEVSKVRKLNPKRYIIMTSAGLSPANKKYIQNLFDGYIISPSDIIGGNEIKSLLGNYKSVERKHYKLWLSSTNTLQSIINNNILNRSEFTEKQIKNKIRIYVQNDSFTKALQLLKETGFLIISGSPGVGKTTLAEMLSYSFIAKGYEFYEISDDIEEAEKVFLDSQKQIFYYDDFLGRNFLEKNLSKNEDKRLLNFINKIVLSNNKILIITTREYILRQAKLKYDLFKDIKFDINKYIISVENYSKFIRAKILYNHLYFSEVSQAYAKRLIEGKTYEKIIQHKNYNPRIINSMTNKLIIEDISIENYPKQFLYKLDYPNDIWEHVFENQIEESSQYILLFLMVMGDNVNLCDLERNFNNLNIRLNTKFNNRAFKNGIKELEKTFITIYKEKYRNEIKVTFQNPSIKDFLITYSSRDNSIIELIWNTTLFMKPLLNTFSSVDNEGKIKIPSQLRLHLVRILIRRFEDFEDSSSLNMKLARIRDISEIFVFDNYSDLKNLLIYTIKECVVSDLDDVSDYIFLLYKYEKILSTEIDYKANLYNIIESANQYNDLDHILFIIKNFYEIFEGLLNEINFLEIIELIWEDTEDSIGVDQWEPGQLEYAIDTYEEISSLLNIDTSIYIDKLVYELSEISQPNYDSIEDYPWGGFNKHTSKVREDNIIEALFNTLLDN